MLDFLGTEYRSEYGSLINRLDIGYVLQDRQWYGQTGLRLYDTDGSLHLLRCTRPPSIALMLKREDRIKGYGLELPNIQKDADKAEAEIIAKEMIAEP